MYRRILFLLQGMGLLLCACSGNASLKGETKGSDLPAEASEALSPKAYPLLDKASWLLGTWYTPVPEGFLYEEWKRQNDSVFSARSFFVAGTDTSFGETISLEQRGDTLWYIPVVANQNDGKPIPFRAGEITAKELNFENPEHDFPQKISYRLEAKDSLMTEISGNVKGKYYAEQLPLIRY